VSASASDYRKYQLCVPSHFLIQNWHLPFICESVLCYTPKNPSAQISVIAQKTELPNFFFWGGGCIPQPPRLVRSWLHLE